MKFFHGEGGAEQSRPPIEEETSTENKPREFLEKESGVLKKIGKGKLGKGLQYLTVLATMFSAGIALESQAGDVIGKSQEKIEQGKNIKPGAETKDEGKEDEGDSVLCEVDRDNLSREQSIALEALYKVMLVGAPETGDDGKPLTAKQQLLLKERAIKSIIRKCAGLIKDDKAKSFGDSLENVTVDLNDEKVAFDSMNGVGMFAADTNFDGKVTQNEWDEFSGQENGRIVVGLTIDNAQAVSPTVQK